VFDWITSVISSGGYLGIVALMLAENVFPRIPSELIMPLAGTWRREASSRSPACRSQARRGALPGALPGYFLGRWLGRERLCAFAARHGRWLTLDERELGQANRLLVAGAFVVRRALGHFASG
jgi:membrane protein DedA with SNARE-associated domain